ncbi:MAG: dethiobiotin synthase [Acidimicrobiales bacterium]
MRLVLVAGTATDVGKTWVTAALVQNLAGRGVAAVARKPVQSYDPADDAARDADVLGAAGGEPPEVVCPSHRWLAAAMAPPMATEVLGLPPVLLDDLVAELAWPDVAPTVGFVESVGGVRSPLADDGDTVDLADRLAPDLVVLVADAGLGVVNSATLAAAALTAHPTAVFLNRYDPTSDLHRRNGDWLRFRLGLGVDTTLDALADRLLALPGRPDP